MTTHSPTMPSPAPVPSVRVADRAACDAKPPKASTRAVAPSPAEPRTPWNPPAGTKTFSLRRRAPELDATTTEGDVRGWEPCTAAVGGQVCARHELPCAAALVLAVWGGGSYECTFFGGDGKGAGRGRFELIGEAKPAAASDGTVAPDASAEAFAPAAADVDAGDVNEGLEDENEDDEDDEDHEDEDDEDEDDEEKALLRAELAEARETAERALALAERLRGANRLEALTVPKLPPRPVPARPLSGNSKLARRLAEYEAMRDAADAAADRRVERELALQEARMRAEDLRHQRNLSEQQAWFERVLTLERKYTERAEAEGVKATKEATRDLRRRVDSLEETPEKPAGVFEKAAAESLPAITNALGEIAKAKLAKP